ncbi:MAG: hypothetical protein HFH29_16210 [Eubacterium sp.]|nr:hypothetical protein [Eubacterium sp.]
MKDFSHWKEYEGASEGSGRSEKLWLINPDTNQTGLFKYKKDVETTDHVSECIASDIAGLIGIPCAKFEIGMFRGREGSISYNIVEREGITLIEGIYCISLMYDNYDAERLMDIKTGEKYSLEMIKKALNEFKLFEDFLSILVFDYLIGNTDRHQSNWAFCLEDKNITLSPLYDNSSSLCAYVSEAKIDQYLGKDQVLWRSLVDTKSKSLIRITVSDQKLPTHVEVLRFIKKNYYKQTKSIVNNIGKFVTEANICDILNKYGEVLSEKRKTLIKKFLLSKIHTMDNIYTGKE